MTGRRFMYCRLRQHKKFLRLNAPLEVFGILCIMFLLMAEGWWLTTSIAYPYHRIIISHFDLTGGQILQVVIYHVILTMITTVMLLRTSKLSNGLCCCADILRLVHYAHAFIFVTSVTVMDMKTEFSWAVEHIFRVDASTANGSAKQRQSILNTRTLSVASVSIFRFMMYPRIKS